MQTKVIENYGRVIIWHVVGLYKSITFQKNKIFNIKRGWLFRQQYYIKCNKLHNHMTDTPFYIHREPGLLKYLNKPCCKRCLKTIVTYRMTMPGRNRRSRILEYMRRLRN